MESILVSSTVFVVVFGGALAGMALRRVLPENQLGPEVKDIIRLATGLLVTMTALVLGMLVSTANSSYQDRKNELAEMGSNFVLVDGLLTSYGPETQAMRLELRGLAETGLERIWPSQGSQASQLRPKDNGQFFYDHLRSLAPKDDSQVAVKGAAISASINLRHTYWLMFLGTEQSSLTGGCGLVADLHLPKLWSLRAAHQSGIGDAGRLRTRRFRSGVHHHGDVYAVQRSNEDLLFSHSRRIESDGTLNLLNRRSSLLRRSTTGAGENAAPAWSLIISSLHRQVPIDQWAFFDK
jgi:hypothetical protein